MSSMDPEHPKEDGERGLGQVGTPPGADTDAAQGGSREGNKRETEQAEAATFGQMLILALLLLTATVILTIYWFSFVGRLEEELDTPVEAPWEVPAGVVLDPGPPAFRYNPDAKKLVYRGIIDQRVKDELAGLIHAEGALRTDLRFSSYYRAIDDLAYRSRETLKGSVTSLLMLGGLSGVLGVMLRSLVGFVGVVCYKRQPIDVRYWPWYLLRPFIGFILGVVMVLVIEARLITVSEASPTGTMWWAAVAFLAGFGANEFSERLRLLSQALFGIEKPKGS